MAGQAFEARLKQIQKAHGFATVEVGAAVNTYERLLTAQSIAISVFGADVSASVVAAVFGELSEESRILYESDRRMLEE
jgi:hypothetical protein